MKRTPSLTILCSFLSLISATNAAIATQINEHHCVNAKIEKVHTLFTRYSEYATMPGSNYSVALMGSEISLIKMVKSQAKQLNATASSSETAVWIVLQPALVENSSFYPRFLLNCKVNWNSKTSFVQNCALQKDKQHYGLDDLTIKISTSSTDKSCKTNETGIQLDINIVGNKKQIEEIKTETLGFAGALAPLISVFFDEDAFFQNYFENIYSAWMNTL